MPNLTAVLKQLRKQQQEIAFKLKQVNEALMVLSSLNIRTGKKSRTRRMSTAGRARIAAAQKARWAKWRKQSKAA